MERLHLSAKDLFLMLYDLAAVSFAYFLALWFRFDCNFSEIPHEYLFSWLIFTPFYAVVAIIVFHLFHLYHSIWKFASLVELKRILFSTSILAVLHAAAITLFVRRMPISYYLFGAGFQFVLVAVIRFSYRFVLLEKNKYEKAAQNAVVSRVMLIGAGTAGQMILRDLQSARNLKEQVFCIIDDDRNKHGRDIGGVPIVGGREDILLNVERYKIEKIYLTMPGATAEQRRDILDICKETGCQLKSLPGIAELVNGNISVNTMKDVDVVDLLGREPVKVSMEEIYRFISGKVILVTGGGGSIGSELCRQIAKHHPKQLIVFDIYENNAHAIGLELKDKYPSLNLEVLIGSVRDSRRINQVFEKYKPDVVYHAAAHKHVPLMEDSPCEAIKNNVLGTYNTADMAEKYGVQKFVLISTDKAVNPTNIMGASKRLCEMVVQCRTNSNTTFAAVRFGNVLGSNGSVIPLFKRQIANGGPVTITDRRIIRYFMTIPEASQLVMQAGAMAKRGELFVLDMGKPIRIYDLAYNMIRLSGLMPGKDIEIKEIGLRPGEKLYEELLIRTEELTKTDNNMIFIETDTPLTREEVEGKLVILKDAVTAAENDLGSDKVKAAIKKVVPTFFDPAELNAKAAKTKEMKEANKK